MRSWRILDFSKGAIMAKFQFQPLEDDKVARLQACVTETRDILGSIANGAQVGDMRELLKPRKGYEQHLPTLVQLIDEYHVGLPGSSLDDMKRNINVQKQLSNFINQLDATATLARELYNAARSESWDAFLNFYGVLNAMGSRYHDLQTRMKPLNDIMSRKSSKRDDEDVDNNDKAED